MSITKDAPLDPNLSVADFEKLSHHEISHLAFATLDAYMEKHKGQAPAPWSVTDAHEFLALAKEMKSSWKDAKFDDIKGDLKLLFQFAFTARGVFNPLCAFYGGFVAQEAIKAITSKFTPTQ
jgi:hypothetical protein